MNVKCKTGILSNWQVRARIQCPVPLKLFPRFTAAAISVHLTQLKLFPPVLFLSRAPDYFLTALNNGLNFKLYCALPSPYFRLPLRYQSVSRSELLEIITGHEMNKRAPFWGSFFPGLTLCVFYSLTRIIRALYRRKPGDSYDKCGRLYCSSYENNETTGEQ